MAYQETELDEAALDAFLNRLKYAETDVVLLSRAHFLLQPRVTTFFEEVLPNLLRGISHGSTGLVELSRLGTRGRILWPDTLRSRMSGRGAGGGFVVRRTDRSSDLPENQMLKLFLARTSATVAAVSQVVGTTALMPQLEKVRHVADRALKEPYLREVQMQPKATSLMRQRAKRHRNAGYGRVAELQDNLEAVLRQGKWEAILSLLRVGWAAPVDDDDLFELYVLVLVLDLLEHELGFGEPYEHGLILRNRKEVARFNGTGSVSGIDVYFDQNPATIFRLKSEYKTVMAAYEGVSGSAHRPDLTLRFRLDDGRERRLLVEVKKTEDDKYKRDSVYKVLGYLQDFRALWNDGAEQWPKAVLVFPRGVEAVAGTEHDERDLALVSSNQRERFADLLQEVAGS